MLQSYSLKWHMYYQIDLKFTWHFQKLGMKSQMSLASRYISVLKSQFYLSFQSSIMIHGNMYFRFIWNYVSRFRIKEFNHKSICFLRKEVLQLNKFYMIIYFTPFTQFKWITWLHLTHKVPEVATVSISFLPKQIFFKGKSFVNHSLASLKKSRQLETCLV